MGTRGSRNADPRTVRRPDQGDVLVGTPAPSEGEWMDLKAAAAAFGETQAEVRRWIDADSVEWRGAKKHPQVLVLPAEDE